MTTSGFDRRPVQNIKERVRSRKAAIRKSAASFREKIGEKTAIHLAAALGNMPVVRRYLKQGGDPNLVDAEGNTLLHYANQLPMIKLLLKNGADVNTQNNEGITKLQSEVSGGKINHVRFLLSNGADPNIADNNGVTPLHCGVSISYLTNFSLAKALIFKSAGVAVVGAGIGAGVIGYTLGNALTLAIAAKLAALIAPVVGSAVTTAVAGLAPVAGEAAAGAAIGAGKATITAARIGWLANAVGATAAVESAGAAAGGATTAALAGAAAPTGAVAGGAVAGGVQTTVGGAAGVVGISTAAIAAAAAVVAAIVIIIATDIAVRNRILEQLLDGGANPNAQDADGNTALHALAMGRVIKPKDRNGGLIMAKHLLKAGARRDIENNEGLTAAEIAGEYHRVLLRIALIPS
jgi:hypothetical protein